VPPTIVVEVLNTHHMINTFFHIPDRGMGSLLKKSLRKAVGKRNGVRHLLGRRSEGCRGQAAWASFFPKKYSFSCVFCLCFSGAPEHKKNTSHTTKNITKKNTSHTTEKSTTKTQVIPQYIFFKKINAVHTNKNKKTHKSYHNQKHQKKTPVMRVFSPFVLEIVRGNMV